MTTGRIHVDDLEVEDSHMEMPDEVRVSLWPVRSACLFLFVLLVRPSDFVPSLEVFHPALLTFILALFTWSQVAAPRMRLYHKTTQYALAFLAVCVLSLLVSYWRSATLEQVVSNAKQFALFVFLINCIRSIRDTRYILLTITCCMSVHAVSVIRDFLTGNYRQRVEGMADGMFGDPNDLALAFVISIPIVYWLILSSQGWIVRGLLSLLLLLLGGGIIGTQSRGGFLGLMLMSALLFKVTRHKGKALLLGAIAAGAVLVIAPPGAFQRFQEIPQYKQDASANQRLYLMKSGLKMFARHPILGVGANASGVALQHIAGDNTHRAIHNSIIQVAAELGILGLFTWLGMIAHGFVALRDSRRRVQPWLLYHPDASTLLGLLEALQSALMGFMVCAFFLTRAYDWLLMILLALAVVGWKLAGDLEATAEDMSWDVPARESRQ